MLIMEVRKIHFLTLHEHSPYSAIYLNFKRLKHSFSIMFYSFVGIIQRHFVYIFLEHRLLFQKF